MDETYMKSLEKRNAELVDKLEQVSSLLNSYQKMVRFEIHSIAKSRVDAFDAVEVISLTVYNGAANRVFATIEPAFGFKREWIIEYGCPFDDEFAKEKQRKVVLKDSDVQQVYKRWCADGGIEFNPSEAYERHSLNAILVKIAMGLTGTEHIEFVVPPKFG